MLKNNYNGNTGKHVKKGDEETKRMN